METLSGFQVLRGAVEPSLIDDALRTINLDLFGRGILPDEVKNYRETATWFPWLRAQREILAVERALPARLRTGQLCESQILLHLPDRARNFEITPHVDKEPPWAGQRRYTHIVGVALSRGHERDGGLLVCPFGQAALEPVELDPGDVVVMHPRLQHTSGANRTGAVRFALYFRYLEVE